MIVYSIMERGGDGATAYFATLAEAREALAQWYENDEEIERLTLVDLPPRALAVRLLNGEQFVTKRKVVS